MSYERKIHDYLNGDLAPEEEKKLFDGIARNAEWREELTLQMRMHQSMQRDLGNVVIPAAITTQVFSKLGFSAPTGAAANGLTGFWKHAISKSVSVVTSASPKFILGFVLNSVVLTGIGYWAYESQMSNPQPQHAAHSSTAASQAGRFPGSGSANARVNAASNASDVQPKPALAQEIKALDGPRVSIVSQNSTNAPAVDANKIGSKTLEAGSQIAASPSVASSSTLVATPPSTLRNEPIKSVVEVGKLSSTAYLSPTKIIGVADGGAIYYSEDAGTTWLAQQSNTKSDLSGVSFFDEMHGIVVGSNGTVLITRDAGKEWRTVSTGVAANLATVTFAGRDTAYACGSFGTILRTTSAGTSWQRLTSGTTANLFLIKFENGQRGVVNGSGVVLRTMDSGQSWQ